MVDTLSALWLNSHAIGHIPGTEPPELHVRNLEIGINNDQPVVMVINSTSICGSILFHVNKVLHINTK